jgi:hypothetical protein
MLVQRNAFHETEEFYQFFEKTAHCTINST